jgi:hypothetical protein
MLTGVLVLLLVPCGPARAQSGVTVPTDLAGSARIADGDGDGRAVVGSVLESHEIIDEAYNNVTGSEVVASAAGLDGAAAAPPRLPSRPH